MPLASGTHVGPYEVVDLLGQGGMGEVYRARDRKLNRDVALKLLPGLFAHDPERLARFRREAQVLAALSHPNIATIHGLEEAESVHALVLELVEGPTLGELISAGGAGSKGAGARPTARGGLPLAEALPIARQIVDALEEAHEHGIVHRDLKPANVKIRPDGTVKVLDFGLAKLGADGKTSGADEKDLDNSPTLTVAATQLGIVLGTAAYMSPEQARGKPVDKRTDIWSFGCLLYEMLTGRRAFEGSEVTDVLARIIERDPDFAVLPAATPPAIRRLLRRSLEKDRKRRLPDMAVARLEIEEALAAPSAETGPAPAPARPRGIAALAVGAALLAVALAVTAALYFTRVAPQPLTTRLDVVTPPTGDPFSFAISPDGRRLVFVANVEGESRLLVRSLSDATTQPLADTGGAIYPFWSPDGQFIGFFADSKLKQVEFPGGTVRVLADAPSARGGSWSRDGVIVFAPRFNAALMRVDAAGGTPAPLAPLESGQSSQRWPQFLPDGRRYLYFSIAEQHPERAGVFMGSLDGGQPSRVLEADSQAVFAAPGYLLRVSQGVLLAHEFDVARGVVSDKSVAVAASVGVDATTFRAAVSASESDVLVHRSGAGVRRQLVWADRAGRIQSVAGGSADAWNASGPALAPDGTRVVSTRVLQQNGDIWLLDLRLGIGSRLTSHPALENFGTWSPDGRQVVFSSTRSGRLDLFIRPADGSADEQPLFVSDSDKASQDWSSDGRFLLYSTQDAKTRADLWALPIKTPVRTGQSPVTIELGKPFTVAQTEFEESQGQFSPDTRWVAYTSNETGRSEVYVRAFPDVAGKQQISRGGGVYPRWARDGRELFYVTPNNRLMAVPISQTPDGRTPVAGAAVELFRTQLATPGSNTSLLGSTSRSEYAVARDGRFLMNVVVEEGAASPISVVLDWTGALRPGR
jgi:Tol biopolymer transport system component/tRNA A-37 threonylcarbamoyl transferase component Bud32